MNQIYSIEEIKTELNLIKSIEFLKNGFKESDKFAYKLLLHLINANKDIGFYGFSLLKNGKLCGSILTLFQGYLNTSGNKKVPIYNLSSWYVNKNSRGLPAIQHLKYVLNYLEDSIITDYTPGEDVLPLLGSLGFENMNAYMLRKFKPSINSLINPKNIGIKKINGKFLKNKFIFLGEPHNLSNVIFFSVEVEKNLLFYFAGIHKKTKIKGIKVESFYILWNSSFKYIYLYFDQLYLYFLTRYKTFALYSYLSKNDLNESRLHTKYFKRVPFILKTSKDLEFISPLNSELSIGKT